MARKRDIDACINAILEKDSGIGYARALDRNSLAPLQFFSAAKPGLKKIIAQASGRAKRTLEAIAGDDARIRELFRMEPWFVAGQYDAVMAGEQRRLYSGTLLHPANIEGLVYHALTKSHPLLGSRRREDAVRAVKSLPNDLEKHFQDIGLGGVMQLMPRAFEEGRQTSPYFLLEIFDRAYMKKRKEKSLFDLKQKHHVHMWDLAVAPQGYWKSPANVEDAVYHALAEKMPSPGSRSRKKVVGGIKRLPYNLGDYFRSLGFGGMMVSGFGKGERSSPLAMLKAFDRAYMRSTGDKSLFDLSERYHLHEWGDNFEAPLSYWKSYANVEKAVYHILTERRPSLASRDRLRAIQAVRSLPSNLSHYFRSLPGMGSIMLNGLRRRDSGYETLRAYADAYRKNTGNPSLLAKRDGDCLKFDGKNRLVRHAS